MQPLIDMVALPARSRCVTAAAAARFLRADSGIQGPQTGVKQNSSESEALINEQAHSDFKNSPFLTFSQSECEYAAWAQRKPASTPLAPVSSACAR